MVMIGFRVDESDHEWLRVHAKDANLALSVYLRQLVRLARATDGELSAQAALIDAHTAHLIKRELRRQGYNLNQGMHALNTIAMHLKHGRTLDKWAQEFFERAELALNSTIDAHTETEQLIRSLDCRIILGG